MKTFYGNRRAKFPNIFATVACAACPNGTVRITRCHVCNRRSGRESRPIQTFSGFGAVASRKPRPENFIDTSILKFATFPGENNASALVFELARAGLLEAWASPAMLEEYAHVLSNQPDFVAEIAESCRLCHLLTELRTPHGWSWRFAGLGTFAASLRQTGRS